MQAIERQRDAAEQKVVAMASRIGKEQQGAVRRTSTVVQDNDNRPTAAPPPPPVESGVWPSQLSHQAAEVLRDALTGERTSLKTLTSGENGGLISVSPANVTSAPLTSRPSPSLTDGGSLQTVEGTPARNVHPALASFRTPAAEASPRNGVVLGSMGSSPGVARIQILHSRTSPHRNRNEALYKAAQRIQRQRTQVKFINAPSSADAGAVDGTARSATKEVQSPSIASTFSGVLSPAPTYIRSPVVHSTGA